jgi:hypothetical protein
MLCSAQNTRNQEGVRHCYLHLGNEFEKDNHHIQALHRLSSTGDDAKDHKSENLCSKHRELFQKAKLLYQSESQYWQLISLLVLKPLENYSVKQVSRM